MQQTFRIERHLFSEEINEIAVSSNDGNGIQSINSVELYAYRTSKDLVFKREEIKSNNIIKEYKKL